MGYSLCCLLLSGLSIPVLLVFSIETAIWINLSFPYFTGQSLSFIGYLIISTVQLGATVDYAILLTNAYLRNREDLPKKDAIKAAIGSNLAAILISAIILATAGFTLAFTSANPIIMNLILARPRNLAVSCHGGRCAAGPVLLFDKVVQKTT